MLFTSQPFIVLFLPLTLAAFYLNAGSPVTRQRVLLVASILFYGYWDIRFVPLLLGSIAGNWILTRVFVDGSARAGILLGVGLNLALLGVFKYADFVADSLCGLSGCEHTPWDLILPLGISFFTFQQISYLLDLRRGKAALYGFEEYATYIAFFPQLIAGPIVRHNELIPQFGLFPLRDGLYERLSRGATLFILGTCKKVFLADQFAPMADLRFDAVAASGILDAAQAWVGTLAYTMQIYFDFSAYSDMAIGLGMMFGFQLPSNFNRPYRASSIRDFWQRWHMTLSSFLRDYVYIPLGGSRHGSVHAAIAAGGTMLLCGLWHGAGWTFVAWGALHGVAIGLDRWWSARGIPLPAALAWSLTMAFVICGWVLFRAGTFDTAAAMFASLGGLHGWQAQGLDMDEIRLIAVGACFALFGPTNEVLAGTRLIGRNLAAVTSSLALVVVLLWLGAGRSLEFVYFQF